MKKISIVTVLFSFTFALILAGCAAMEESSDKGKKESPPTITQQPAEAPQVEPPQEQPKKVDTVSVKPMPQPTAQETTKSQPVQTPAAQTPTGNFAVQIGAFNNPQAAEQIASMARQRFPGKNVRTVFVKDVNATKVFVGEFMSKDEARNFRDQMVQQFPDDYKDAWVAPIPYE